MQDELNQLALIALVMAPIISGLTQLTKQLVPAKDKLLPVVPIILGIVVGVFWALVFKHSVAIYALSGVLSGLQASGYYTLINKPTTDKSQLTAPTVVKTQQSGTPGLIEEEKTNGQN